MLDSTQVAQQVGQAGEAGRGDEPRVDELVELGADVLDRRPQCRRGEPVEPLPHAVRQGEHALHELHGLQHRVVQVGAHLAAQCGESLLVPDRSAVAVHQCVDGAGQAVLQQRRHAAVGVVAERELRVVVEPALDPAQR
jgi:hypothetical protein